MYCHRQFGRESYKIKEDTMYQDNMSAMLLEKNGRRSSGKRTRRINIRYFFVDDRIDAKETNIEYCPASRLFPHSGQGLRFHVPFCTKRRSNS